MTTKFLRNSSHQKIRWPMNSYQILKGWPCQWGSGQTNGGGYRSLSLTMSERPCQRPMSERPCQRDHIRESHSCLRVCGLVSGRVFGLRACFTLEGKRRPQLCTPKKSWGRDLPSRVKHALSFNRGGRGMKLCVQWVGPQGVSQPGEGVGFWGWEGWGRARACEGVWGRARACFTLTLLWW